jgi:HMG (high mobility group) box
LQKEEREKILKILSADDPYKVEQDPNSQDFLSEAQIGSLRKEGNKVSFEQMGKIIGARWKNIDPDRLAKFSELASEDTERYKKEMQSYNGRQEAKMRSEALKPQAYAAANARRSEMAGSVSSSQDPRQQAYPELNPGYSYASGYGYDAYGYSMYGYGSPGYGYSTAMGGGGSPEQMAAYAADPYGRGMADQYQMGYAGYE